MAQTLVFNIPAPSQGQEPVYRLNWYESGDGLTWGIKIDTILVSDLTRSSDGKYHWTSLVSDPAKYHQLKTETEYGIESLTGFIIPPENSYNVGGTPSDVWAQKIDDGSESYSIGDTIQLMLDVDEEIVSTIGTTITVFIIDRWGNTIATTTASLVGDTMYAASWKIPKSVIRLYNINKEADTDSDRYHLSDQWIMPSNTFLKYDFTVAKAPSEQPASDNAIISMSIDGLESDGAYFDKQEIKFTTKLNPAYCTVEDVRDVYPEILNTIDAMSLASNILTHSLNLDYTMKPDVIKYKDRYLNACRNYVAHDVAENLILASASNVEEESRQLDTFKVSKKYSFSKGVLKLIREHKEEFGNIIYAGGEDTIFTTKRFIKGLFDPNRVELGRSHMDTSGNRPWLNTTTKSSIVRLADGSDVEIRGTRTINYVRPY